MEDFEIIKKRFIASAVCPSCDVVDRIVVETAVSRLEDCELSRRRCVDCGFADEFSSSEKLSSPVVPKGRPEKPKAVPAQATIVRILDPGPPKVT